MLEQAAEASPADVEINEHLGDAYFAIGRRSEARFAWAAARVHAEGARSARSTRLGAAKIETPALRPPPLAARAEPLRETAYAKLNLALHVRAREADGYHRIETVFAFCEDGDVLTAAAGGGLSPRHHRAVRRRAGRRGRQSGPAGRPRRWADDGGADPGQAPAGRVRDRRRLGRCGGGAAPARRRSRGPAAIAAGLGADVPACLLAAPRAARAAATGSTPSRSRASPARRSCSSIRASRFPPPPCSRLGRRRSRPARRLARGAQRPRSAGALPRPRNRRGARCAWPAPASPACPAPARPASASSRQRGRARRTSAAADRARDHPAWWTIEDLVFDDPLIPSRHSFAPR